MKQIIGCLWYTLRHKWYVFLECRKLGIPWLGVIHDWSKFLPGEFFPFTYHFFDTEGIYHNTLRTPLEVDGNYDAAKLLHIRRNRHHWQSWALFMDDGVIRAIEIPDRYQREMLADWRGASRVQGIMSISEWYMANKETMYLHPTTRQWIESQL